MQYFYAALLVNDASAFLLSHHEKSAKKKLLGNIRARLPQLPYDQETPNRHNETAQGRRGGGRGGRGHGRRETNATWSALSQRLATGILEESRHSIAEALHKRWDNHRGGYRSGLELHVSFAEISDGERKHSRCGIIDERYIKTSRHFSEQEKINLLRPGTIIELRPAKLGKIGIDEILLGTLSHSRARGMMDSKVIKLYSTKTDISKDGRYVIKLYSTKTDISKDGRYRLYPLSSLLTFARQLEALFSLVPDRYPALMPLVSSGGTEKQGNREEIGQRKQSTTEQAKDLSSTLFSVSKECPVKKECDLCTSNTQVGTEKNNSTDGVSVPPDASLNNDDTAGLCVPPGSSSNGNHFLEHQEAKGDPATEGKHGGEPETRTPQYTPPPEEEYTPRGWDFAIPKLNESQENSMKSFLGSTDGSITLVQGPPGTGKSTLLVATICMFLLERQGDGVQQPRLMVCAPSNKAVAVLAARYLTAIKTKSSPFHVAMVGDKNKLLNEDRLRFKDIHIYDWVPSMLNELKGICRFLTPRNTRYAQKLMESFSTRLCSKLPSFVLHPLRGVDAMLQDMIAKIRSFDMKGLAEVREKVESRLKEKERKIQSHLLDRANVIFCTLSTAGSSIVKRSKSVEGLIIDEAAAAVEPESYIPIAGSGPRRIMMVGDPKQLPATILSPYAKTFGVEKSLQERLMFDEMQPYTMLNVQYRMRPEISIFPSSEFYDGEICNGLNVMQTAYQSPACCSLVTNMAYSFVHVDGKETRHPTSRSFLNWREAEKVVEIVMDLRRKTNGLASIHKLSGNEPWFSIRRVRVIAFYQAQVELISDLLRASGLHQIGVSTVDSSQGSEADLIIASFVRTGESNEVGFLSDVRRLNVALTRAKHKFICVGNSKSLIQAEGSNTATIRHLVQNAIDRGVVISTYSPNQINFFESSSSNQSNSLSQRLDSGRSSNRNQRSKRRRTCR